MRHTSKKEVVTIRIACPTLGEDLRREFKSFCAGLGKTYEEGLRILLDTYKRSGKFA